MGYTVSQSAAALRFEYFWGIDVPAVGVAAAGLPAEVPGLTSAGVLALSAGSAIQNIPEDAMVAAPLRAEGRSRSGAFFGGFTIMMVSDAALG